MRQAKVRLNSKTWPFPPVSLPRSLLPFYFGNNPHPHIALPLSKAGYTHLKASKTPRAQLTSLGQGTAPPLASCTKAAEGRRQRPSGGCCGKWGWRAPPFLRPGVGTEGCGANGGKGRAEQGRAGLKGAEPGRAERRWASGLWGRGLEAS